MFLQLCLLEHTEGFTREQALALMPESPGSLGLLLIKRFADIFEDMNIPGNITTCVVGALKKGTLMY